MQDTGMDERQMGAMSVNEARRYLGDIGRTKFYELVNSGRIPKRRIGTRVVFLKCDLDDFLAGL
jgi:excisionase family DNA binding protein